MKKIGLLFIVSLVVMSCGSSDRYKPKSVKLVNFQDSINYAVGHYNGDAVKNQIFTEDKKDDEAVVKAFIDGLTEGYSEEAESKSEIVELGTNIAMSIKENEKTGLAQNKSWPLDEVMLFKGFINGIMGDTSLFAAEKINELIEEVSSRITPLKDEDQAIGLVKKGTCPTKREILQVNMTNTTDSLNYFFGYMNGFQVMQYVLTGDSTSEKFNELVTAINAELKNTSKFSKQLMMGKQIGNAIKAQENVGLLGISGWETKFEIIKQGFINGMNRFEEMMETSVAQEFVSQSIDKAKFGDVKQKNAEWLDNNAKKEGVKVTPSGLQYVVLKMGKGAKPKQEDKVRVHYHGTLTDGTVFDSSVDRGEPAEFPLNGVIAGWTAGLQLMPVGSKFRFYIKPELGYGANDMGSIPPYSILIFDVELLEIKNN